MKNIDKVQLLTLQKVLPPKDRIRFLSRQKIVETDLEKIAYIDESLAESYIRMGKLIQAEQYAKLSLENFRKLDDEEAVVQSLRRLGTIYRTQGRYLEAIKSYIEARNLCEHHKDQLSLANTNRQIGQTYLEMGELQNAQTHLNQAYTILSLLLEEKNARSEIRTSLAYVLNALGNVYLLLGNLQEALDHITQAKDIHVAEVGANHFYVAYDLRHIAKVELALGNAHNAITHLRQSLQINQRFFGSSPNVAIIHIALAQAYREAQNVLEAKREAFTALDMYKREVGKESKFVAYAHRVLGEIFLQEANLEEAKYHSQRAYDILRPKHAQTPHMAEVELLSARIQLQNHDNLNAVQKLWQVRSMFIKFKMREKLQEVDRLLLSGCLEINVEAWNKSVLPYKLYLQNFPESLHNQLGERLVQSLEEFIDNHQTAKPQILDIFCGTGFVSQKIVHRQKIDVDVVGIDGSERMIEEANLWQSAGSHKNHTFYKIPEKCEDWNNTKYNFATIHMGINQIDIRMRHMLFQHLLPRLDDECIILFSTYSADFQFPSEFEKNYPKINQTSPFKENLFRQFALLNYEPNRSLEDSVTPIFIKENLANLANFFEFYGFQLTPLNAHDNKILEVKRTWKDRATFTKIPVISQKVFGNELSQSTWTQLQPPKEYSDVTYGVVLSARRILKLKKIPTIFSHVNVDFLQGVPVKYAVSVLLKNNKGQILFPKRGVGARDYQGSWSLSSTFVDEDKGIKGSLYESLSRNMNIQESQISGLAPLSIRFNMRENSDGNKWIMAMCLFEGVLEGEPKLMGPKYESFVWEDGPRFVYSLKSQEMGDCTKSYRDLLNCGLL